MLLDFCAQPLMLEELAFEGLGLTKDMLETCPWTINTSMGGTKCIDSIMRSKLGVRLHYDDVENATCMKVKAIVTQANSYDDLVGVMILYPMDTANSPAPIAILSLCFLKACLRASISIVFVDLFPYRIF